jgi:hypothetical protein
MSLAFGERARTVPRRLHRGQERRAHLVDLEFAQSRSRRAARRGDLLAENDRVGPVSRSILAEPTRVCTTRSVAVARGRPRCTPASIIDSTTKKM